MSKRLIYLVLFALIGAFVMFQSCSDTPVTTEETPMIGEGKVKFAEANTFNVVGKLAVKNYATLNLDTMCRQIKLYAGAGNRESARWVGNVYLTKTGGNLHVVYDFDDATLAPWVPIDVHFDISGDYAGLHDNNSGNPSPGQFTYVHNFEPPYTVRNWGFDIDLSGITCETAGIYYVAVHSSVRQFGGIPGFNFYLPDNVTLQNPVYAPNGGAAYWKFKIADGGFISSYDSDGPGPLLPGEYLGWCVDVDHTLGGGSYPAQLFSSYETLPAWLTAPGMLEGDENLDKVNYLVNHFNVGQQVQLYSNSCTPLVDGLGNPVYGNLTYGDIQRAIWILVVNGFGTNGPYVQERVNAIICNVNANGENFVPACNEKIVFIVVPNLGNTVTYQLVIGQPIIGMTPVPCEDQDETCWGDGKYGANWVGGNSWATWFKWNTNLLTCP